MSIGLQAVELSPCHAGLAEPRGQRLLPFSAFSAGSCSLALSGSGKPLTLGSPLNPTHLRWGCCMHYCGAPDAGGSRLQAIARRRCTVPESGWKACNARTTARTRSDYGVGHAELARL